MLAIQRSAYSDAYSAEAEPRCTVKGEAERCVCLWKLARGSPRTSVPATGPSLASRSRCTMHVRRAVAAAEAVLYGVQPKHEVNVVHSAYVGRSSIVERTVAWLSELLLGLVTSSRRR